jgi:hypothetical protein
MAGAASAGAFASGGAFAQVVRQDVRIPNYPSQPIGAVGAFAGAGAFFTNANSASDLSGPFDTYSFNLEVGPVQFSVQFGCSNGVGILSASVGPSIEINASRYPTTTGASLNDAGHKLAAFTCVSIVRFCGETTGCRTNGKLIIACSVAGIAGMAAMIAASTRSVAVTVATAGSVQLQIRQRGTYRWGWLSGQCCDVHLRQCG